MRPSGAQLRSRSEANVIILRQAQERGHLPRGRIDELEGTQEDRALGMDYVIASARGQAVGVQIHLGVHDDYQNITIRAQGPHGRGPVELHKRRASLDGGSYPLYHVQGYYDLQRDILLNWYIVETERLFRHVMPVWTAYEDMVWRPGYDLCSCAYFDSNPDKSAWISIPVGDRYRRWRRLPHSLPDAIPVLMAYPVDQQEGLWDGWDLEDRT